MAAYQLGPNGSVIREEDGAQIPPDPANADYQEYLAWVAAGNTPDPADPPPIRYVGGERVNVTLRTTDDLEHDVFVVPADPKTIYRAELQASALDAGNGACKFLAGILVWKRLTGSNVIAPPSNITVVSQIQDTAAASWIMNGLPSGGAFRIFVKGAAGRTIDWSLVGEIGRYAPEGIVP
jgi:hypothetical protein